ncbi:nuclear pore complex protein Nup107 [Amyelois transitella]|uniref:nuclear pore complex protein Nup107 n=1 Tax=Amyelois transitella TaxID=680683 RepID=UPI00067D6C85|nr:nuclear pore complex protein Nup107 [Amyelois transitella]
MALNLDRSLQLHSTQHTPLRNKRTRQLLSREDTLNLSPILNETSIFKNLNDTSLRQVLDESSILVNSGNAGDGLNEAFFEVMQTCKSSDVLDTLLRLGQVCCDSLELVEPWNRYNVHNYWLAEEANTWKLLHCLYADSISPHPESLETMVQETTLSQQDLVGALFQCDSEIRLLQLLVDWLEATAAYQEAATNTSAPVIGNNVHWSNTLHELLIGNSLFNKEKNKTMITCIDPDAPRRQKKTIHSDDQKDDNALCKRIFTEVRCGKFKEAVSVCLSAGQAWRGAVLQGWILLHYLPRDDPNEQLEIFGNPSRDLWKWCALGIANNTAENIHYRAITGILCGHLGSAIPACQGSWEDLLWAHLRVQIEARVDRFLHEHHLTVDANTTPSDILELLQSELIVEVMSLQQIFSAVKSMMDGKRESHYQTCQRHLMLGHIRAVMQDSLEWLDSAGDKFIRFLAHLILVLRMMGKDPHHDIGDKVLEKYVSQLIDQLLDGSVECPELIAYYTSTVPVARQIALYADLMDHIHKSEYREGVVKAGINAGIDVAASARVAIKKAISAIQHDYWNLDMSFTQNAAIEKDKSLINKVISSLEWLGFISNQKQEALWLSNAMIRTFIFIGNTEAALSCVANVSQLFPDFVKNLDSRSAELREHLALKSYLEALEGFATWHRHFISGQPKDVEALPADATFSDKVHHEQRCAQVEQQKARWKNAVLHQSRHTKNMLYNVLLFPGGWLQDENDSIASNDFTDEEKRERSKQLETLRRLCIPEVVILILKILQSDDDVESHKEALKLSNIIAGENRRLYKVFTKAKLIEFLERIKESSLLLLEKDKDMFGYEINDD